MNTAFEYSTRVVQEGGRRCKKSTLNDLVHLTPLRIPLMNPPMVCMKTYAGVDQNLILCRLQHVYHGQPYAKVDLNTMPESTLSPSQEFRIWPQGYIQTYAQESIPSYRIVRTVLYISMQTVLHDSMQADVHGFSQIYLQWPKL
jgi:hypothetical protein